MKIAIIGVGTMGRYTTKEENKTWSILFRRQTELIKNRVCRDYIIGSKKMNLNPNKVPQLSETSKKIEKLSVWNLAKAEIKYLTDRQWFRHLKSRNFPVTDYIRKQNELDFTPLPDMFHDYFGHLPYLTNKETGELYNLFGIAFALAPKGKKHHIARLWWHTIEFGLIKENGEVKVLGAGLISSHKELLHSLNPKLHRPFDFNEIIKTPKAKYDIHPKFFVLNSMEQLKERIISY